MTVTVLQTAQHAPEVVPQEAPAFRPSEYTATLIHALRERPGFAYGAAALEIGPGCGVVLAAMGELGAASLCGVDVEGSAVAASAILLHGMGFGHRLEMIQGDMWRPLAGRRFDLIAANLPQFPMEAQAYGGRLSSWSSGGADGRQLVDRFLIGVGDHLSASGCAIITHNAFIDVGRSRQIAESQGLTLRPITTVMIYLAREKLDLMTDDILLAEEGRSIHRYGPHAFGEMHIVEIRRQTNR